MKWRSLQTLAGTASAAAIVLSPTAAVPESLARYNMYGGPGLIDMPTAFSRPDAELAFTVSHFKNQTRNALAFQLTPRLSLAFRYSLRYFDLVENGGKNFDRSLALHYQLFEETPARPAIAVGINDVLGNSFFASEYVVASKNFGERLRVTGGLGWGRLAGVNAFDNPLGVLSDGFETRPPRDTGEGGEVEAGDYFRGDAAFFGGLAWTATDRLTLVAEYSSDAYEREDGTAFIKESPFNFGADYRINDNATFGLTYMYGSEIGARLTFRLNPTHPPAAAGFDPAPPPVVPRQQVAELGWSDAVAETEIRQRVARGLAAEGLRLRAIEITGGTARVDVENLIYGQTSQAVGRTARVLTAALPRRIDRFVIVPVEEGLAGSAVTVARGDLEELEYAADAAWKSYARAGFDGTQALPPAEGRYPAFDWEVGPYLSPSFFDPDAPLRADVGVEVSADYEPWTGFVLSGALRQKVVGNLDESTRESTSVLPRVRSEANIYEREGTTAVSQLTAAQYFQPADSIYGRVTAGYLEPMFGGVSSELLWKPQESRLALGVEVNYARQRDFDQGFGFRDYEVATGHVSAYYDFGGGYHGQLDVGRYLAGDWGATFAVDREFENGWSIGAFATLTDVPFDEFGEGSFDKGLRLTVPIDWLSGKPTREDFTTVLRPVQRDGGARLDVEGRLYDTVRDLHQTELQDSWGRFWK